MDALFGFFWKLIITKFLVFDSFVACTGVSLELRAITVKKESDDPGYYKYNTSGNHTNFRTCLSRKRVDCLSITTKDNLFWKKGPDLEC